MLRVIGPPRSETSDDDLIRAAAADDVAAFRILVERHQTPLQKFCRSILGDESAAKDAAQETFLKLWKVRARYREEGRFLGFLYTLARNTARSMGRRKVIKSWLGLEPAAPALPSDPLDRKGTIDLVSAALDRLPENLRTPLVLRYVDELSYEDIAKVIGRTPSAARSRVFYGLKALRARLPKEGA
jgi:RNA polymerase sigma-70 factor, ECF subfamily